MKAELAVFVILSSTGLVWAQSELEPQPPADDARDRILYSDETERIKPLTTKLVKNLWIDQKEIWTSPFHIRGKDAIPWIAVAGGTAALIASDHWTSTQLPNTVDQVAISKHVSNVGAVYTVLPVTAGFYISGAIFQNPKARETGILGGEAALDSLIVVAAIKAVSQRPRPLESNGRGDFFEGGGSFPSGHSAEIWALASVVAHEYNKNIMFPVTAYGLATLVSFSRLSGRQHFASDVFAGSAMGWFIGRYVFKTHVDHSIHRRPPSKLSLLKPQVWPQFEPETRQRGVTLSWPLSR